VKSLTERVIQARGYWLLIERKHVTICHQELGYAKEWMQTIPIKSFKKMAKFVIDFKP
jgi:hypothetical protein